MSKPTVVVIGNFDGVHLGHRTLLDQARAGLDARLVVLTFWPHPVSVLRPELAPLLLSDLHQRIALLEDAGADEVRVIRFTPEVAELSPEEFIVRYIAPLEAFRVAVGQNFRFGERAVGSVADLQRDGRFEVLPLELTEVDDETTCSTRIRQALVEGDVETAAQHLGRPFRVSGIVEVGDQRGRDLGFPTANLPVPAGHAVPADGVYAGWLTTQEGVRYPAAISVGSNPTFDGVQRRVETYVLDRDDLQLYGSHIDVDFIARIRGQIRFDGIEPLIHQMRDDIEAVRAALAS